MTPETLAAELAADLKLDAASRHALVGAARQLAALPDDAQVRALADALAERHRDRSTLAGAVLTLGIGIMEDRFAASLDPIAREAHEAGMTSIGTRGGAYDSASADPEVAEALAKATDLETAGDKETAARIRSAVAAYKDQG
jgi:hypothetical protein